MLRRVTVTPFQLSITAFWRDEKGRDCSTSGLSFDPTLAYSFLEDCVILLRLVSIGFAKGSDSFIKNIAIANVFCDHRGIAGAGVSTSQRPAAGCSVVRR